MKLAADTYTYCIDLCEYCTVYTYGRSVILIMWGLCCLNCSDSDDGVDMLDMGIHDCEINIYSHIYSIYILHQQRVCSGMIAQILNTFSLLK